MNESNKWSVIVCNLCRRAVMRDMYSSFKILLLISSMFCIAFGSRYHRPQGRRQQPSNLNKQHLKRLFTNNNFDETKNCIHGLCSDVNEYPTHSITSLIANNKEFHKYFGNIVEPYEKPILRPKFNMALEEFDEEKNMCAVTRYMRYPQMALRDYREPVVIVNVEGFRQSVIFEVCDTNSKCFLDDHKPVGYETACRQQYSNIRFVTITNDYNITMKSIPIPSSCVCTYKKILNYR